MKELVIMHSISTRLLSLSLPAEFLLSSAAQAEEVREVLQSFLRPHAAGSEGDPFHRLRQHV